MAPNSRDALALRRDRGLLRWRGPAVVLFARSVLAVAAQGVVAAILVLGGSAVAWQDSEAWLPVYGTLIDLGCLALIWRFTRREGIRLFDLIGFERARLTRDVLLGLLLIPLSLVFILGGVYFGSWLVFGTPTGPYTSGQLPLPAALYGVLIWPWLWGLTEQMTYNGYLLPRFQVLSRSTAVAVAVVSFSWAAQHAFMPMTFDGEFMVYRLVAAVPNSVFQTMLYLRLRRVLPFAIAHALLDGASVLIGVLLPALRAG
ncbi:MAG TPA: CPBP family glutamic-type intramembrane protease [Longimicrobiaceae bacterium]